MALEPAWEWCVMIHDVPHDILFIVGEDTTRARRIPAHRAIVSSSIVLKGLCYGGVGDSMQLSRVMEVSIIDVDGKAFEILLKYLYKELIIDSVLSEENVLAVYRVADKYCVVGLMDECVNFLARFSTAGGVVRNYEEAVLWGYEKIAAITLGWICLDVTAVFRTDGFLGCEVSTLEKILGQDGLVCSELQVYEAMISWLGLRIDLKNETLEVSRKALGPALWKLRPRLMTAAQFANGPAIKLCEEAENGNILLSIVAGHPLLNSRFDSHHRVPIPILETPDDEIDLELRDRRDKAKLSLGVRLQIRGDLAPKTAAVFMALWKRLIRLKGCGYLHYEDGRWSVKLGKVCCGDVVEYENERAPLYQPVEYSPLPFGPAVLALHSSTHWDDGDETSYELEIGTSRQVGRMSTAVPFGIISENFAGLHGMLDMVSDSRNATVFDRHRVCLSQIYRIED